MLSAHPQEIEAEKQLEAIYRREASFGLCFAVDCAFVTLFASVAPMFIVTSLSNTTECSTTEAHHVMLKLQQCLA